jgi:hypothetical protein
METPKKKDSATHGRRSSVIGGSRHRRIAKSYVRPWAPKAFALNTQTASQIRKKLRPRVIHSAPQDTGHFALETQVEEIAHAMREFLSKNVEASSKEHAW